MACFPLLLRCQLPKHRFLFNSILLTPGHQNSLSNHKKYKVLYMQFWIKVPGILQINSKDTEYYPWKTWLCILLEVVEYDFWGEEADMRSGTVLHDLLLFLPLQYFNKYKGGRPNTNQLIDRYLWKSFSIFFKYFTV